MLAGKFVIFQQDQSCLATLCFVSFQGEGVQTPCSPPLDPRMFIRIRIVLRRYSKMTLVLSLSIISLYLTCIMGNAFCQLQNQFSKKKSGIIASDCQSDWTWHRGIRHDKMSDLISVKSVCRSYQQTTTVCAMKYNQ